MTPSPVAADAMPAVHLQRVSRLFGNFVALREVSLALPPGASVVLLGENGAGKSTLLKLLAGLHRPTFGTLRVFGEEPGRGQGQVAYMSHATMLYDELTGLENLTYFARLQGRRDASDAARESLCAVGLCPESGGLSTRRLGEYSQGMRQRAALARVLLGDPELLLLDEPFSNLDTASAQSIIQRLLKYLAEPAGSGRPRTLLLTTHQAELARPLARTTITLAGGRVASITGEAVSA